MTKYDGTLQIDGVVTPLMKVLLQRRSVRKYESQPATGEQVRTIESVLEAFRDRMSFASPRVVILGQGSERDARPLNQSIHVIFSAE